ncbi:MAG: PAS domain S-box protein [Planctomycetes bacterium]|nr:PAS domain S-box protein [Planctomycetota bacterium]
MQDQTEKLEAAALEALPVAVLLVDIDGVIRRRNKAARKLLPLGRTLGEALHGKSGEDDEHDWPGELAGLPDGVEPVSHRGLNLRSADGSIRLADVHIRRLDGQFPNIVVLVEDVTSRVSMQRRLAMSERMAAVGQLAAQVAHELNNPLDGIGRYLGLAERVCKTGQADKAPEYLSRARDGVSRMANIVAELLGFSRPEGAGPDKAPLGSLIDQATEAMSPTIAAAAVTVICNMGPGSGSLVPGDLFQVMCNLMKNAADAMTPGGRLVINSRVLHGQATVTFADSGTGLPEEWIDRIFEPFFSTKPNGKGTGLGLSICRSIVERAGGTIEAANGPNGGAVFTVKVPCSQGGELFH